VTESLFRRLLLRFALLPILCFCVFFGIVGYIFHKVYVWRLTGAEATSVLLQSEKLKTTALDQETGIRGYLATGNHSFLEPYRQGSARFAQELSDLRNLPSPDPHLPAQIARVASDFDQFDAVNEQLMRDGPPVAGPMADLLLQEKLAMDTLRADFSLLDAGQNKTRDITRAEVTRLLAWLPALGIGGGFIITILLIWYAGRLFREITRAYHEQLREIEFKRDSLDTTLQSIGDGVMVCDSAGYITMMNPAAAELTGWRIGQATGRPINEVFNIVNELTRAPIESPVDKVRRLNTVVSLENHTILIRRDGSEVPIDDSGGPIRRSDGGLEGVVLVFRSAAERRQAALLLRRSQERLNSIYNTSLEYIGILTVDGRLLDCNQASLQFGDFTRAEVVGKFFWECPWVQYTDGAPEMMREAILRAASGEATRAELALNRPNGELVNFDFSLAPVFDAEGNVTYLIPEGRDITEQKRAQLALIQSEKLAAVGRLASSIAHEINNPLEAVTNLLYLASSQPLPPQAEEFLRAADHELRRVSVIANQTLRFHKQASSPQPALASELFSTVLGIYEGRLRNANIKVEVCDVANVPVVCFGGDVRQVLSNLIGNAIDAMNDQGGRLLLRSHLATHWHTQRKGIVLTVADNGCGIDPGNVKRIFEPFFTTKGIGGTGLGLWVSEEVAVRHNGALRVRSSSRPGSSGTVFRFFLPLSDS
jgi:PAS domain S-box-containing protein